MSIFLLRFIVTILISIMWQSGCVWNNGNKGVWSQKKTNISIKKQNPADSSWGRVFSYKVSCLVPCLAASLNLKVMYEYKYLALYLSFLSLFLNTIDDKRYLNLTDLNLHTRWNCIISLFVKLLCICKTVCALFAN